MSTTKFSSLERTTNSVITKRRIRRNVHFRRKETVTSSLITTLSNSLGIVKLPWESTPSEFSLVPQHKNSNSNLNSNLNSHSNSIQNEQLAIVPTQQLNVVQQIQKYFEFLNRRDIGMVLNMLSTNCTLHDLGSYVPVKGKAAVAKFYFDFLKSIPDDALFVLDETTGDGEGGSDSLGALWHLELGAFELPRAKGVSFYKFDNQGKIEYIRESPEPLLKMARLAIPSLRFATPVLQNFGPFAVHQAQQLAKMVNFWEALQNSNEPSEILYRTFNTDNQQYQLDKFLPSSTTAPTIFNTATVEADEKPQQQYIQQQKIPQQQYNNNNNSNNNNNNNQNGFVLNGRWKKIPEKSEIENYHRALDLLKLPDLFKNAAKQIDVVNMQQNEEGFSQGFATVIPIQQFQVTEQYLYDKEVAMNRRDYKSGKQFAKLQKQENNNNNLFSIDIWWDDPNKGGVVEEFWVNEDQTELNIRSTVTVGSTTISTLQIYGRI